VRIVFPLAAGGGGDVYTRALADELQKAWHQPVVVENRPGGGQNIGARACAEATPDGYTLCVMSSEPTAYNQFMFKSIPYDPEKDFQPITNLFFNTLAVVVNPDLKVKTLAELIALAKKERGKLSYATFAFPAQVFMDKLNKTEGTDIVRVPYKGGGEVVNALLGGNTPVAVLALSNMVAQLQSGRITPLAVVANARSPLFPDVPTLTEVRPGAAFRTTWFGLFTQSGVPRPIVEKVARDADRIMAQPDFRKRIYTDRGVEPAMERLDDFARFVADERKIAETTFKESGLQPR
jgi:tripartite-type tricarboxylate transporter receptor subunit TctC